MAGILLVFKRIYLTIYNWTVLVGWLRVFYLAVKTLSESGHQHVYDAIKKFLLLAQSTAILEIIHSLVGWVRSPVSAALPQIASRIYVTWGILWSFPEIQTHILVSSLVISWSITEIVRYSFFGTKEAFGSAPSWLFWLRNHQKYCIRMPQKWNFSFDFYYGTFVALSIYVPGSPYLYTYMLGQRKKALSKMKKE